MDGQQRLARPVRIANGDHDRTDTVTFSFSNGRSAEPCRVMTHGDFEVDSLFRYAADHDRHRKILRRRLQYRESSQRNATKKCLKHTDIALHETASPNVGPCNIDDVIGQFVQADTNAAQHAIAATRQAFAS